MSICELELPSMSSPSMDMEKLSAMMRSSVPTLAQSLLSLDLLCLVSERRFNFSLSSVASSSSGESGAREWETLGSGSLSSSSASLQLIFDGTRGGVPVLNDGMRLRLRKDLDLFGRWLGPTSPSSSDDVVSSMRCPEARLTTTRPSESLTSSCGKLNSLCSLGEFGGWTSCDSRCLWDGEARPITVWISLAASLRIPMMTDFFSGSMCSKLESRPEVAVLDVWQDVDDRLNCLLAAMLFSPYTKGTAEMVSNGRAIVKSVVFRTSKKIDCLVFSFFFALAFLANKTVRVLTRPILNSIWTELLPELSFSNRKSWHALIRVIFPCDNEVGDGEIHTATGRSPGETPTDNLPRSTQVTGDAPKYPTGKCSAKHL